VKYWAIAIVSVVIFTIFSCSNESGGFLSNILKGSGSAVPVTVVNVFAETKSKQMDVPATLGPSDSTEITLPEDVTIEQVLVSDGEHVDSGDYLCRISEEGISSKLSELRTDLKEAQANLDKNTYFMRNKDRLIDEGRIDQNQYDNIESEVESNEARVEKLQRSINTAEDRLDNLRIASPSSGTVRELHVAAGLTIQAGNPLMKIVSTDPMLATFNLASHEATTVKPGISISIKLPGSGNTETGRITSVGTELNAKNDTFEVKATVPNRAGYLKSGMRAEVEFTSSQKQRFYIIPAEALIRERRRYFVFTVIKGVAHKVQVVPNETKGNRISIARGLREDDIIVVKGHDKLEEGAIVDIWGK
jgi:membrane fusion protein, multidrug efflux system